VFVLQPGCILSDRAKLLSICLEQMKQRMRQYLWTSTLYNSRIHAKGQRTQSRRDRAPWQKPGSRHGQHGFHTEIRFHRSFALTHMSTHAVWAAHTTMYAVMLCKTASNAVDGRAAFEDTRTTSFSIKFRTNRITPEQTHIKRCAPLPLHCSTLRAHTSAKHTTCSRLQQPNWIERLRVR
jgi:hypothetical protein